MANWSKIWSLGLSASLCLFSSLVLCTKAIAAEDSSSAGSHYTLHGHDISKNQYDAIILFNESYKALQASDYVTAADKLQKSLELDPNQYEALTNYGFVLSRLGRMDEGIAQLKTALVLEPNKPEPICTMAAMYQASGKIKEAIDEYQLFLTRFPKHEIAANVTSVVKQLQEEYKKEQAVASEAKPTDAANDYFGYATYETVAKWQPDKFPLKVYIPSESEAAKIPKFNPQFRTALRNAFDQWAAKSNGTISFTYVPSSAGSNIECTWTDNPSRVSRPSEGGEARVAYDANKGIDHVQIILLTTTPSATEKQIPVNIMQAASLHEIGHGLGILGHSPDADDVMFCSVPAADQSKGLSERDANTLTHLYRSDVKVAYHAHQSEQGGTDKVSLNNEGVNFATAQNFAKAAEKFEAALKADPSYEPSKRNLATCLNNLAIDSAKSGNYADAVTRFKRALELQGRDTDRPKRVAMLRNYVIVLHKLNRNAEAANAEAAIAKLESSTAVTSLKSK